MTNDHKKLVGSCFNKETKDKIKKKFGYICVLCHKYTTGWQGTCAHIISVSKSNDSVRHYTKYSKYKHLQQQDAEKIFNHKSNGLWTCIKCHQLIDKRNPKSEKFFSAKYLKYLSITKSTNKKADYEQHKLIQTEIIREANNILNSFDNLEGTKIKIKKKIIANFFEKLFDTKNSPDEAMFIFETMLKKMLAQKYYIGSKKLEKIIYNYCVLLASKKYNSHLLNPMNNLLKYINECFLFKIEKLKKLTFKTTEKGFKYWKSYFYLSIFTNEEQQNTIQESIDQTFKNYGNDLTKLKKYKKFIQNSMKKFEETIEKENLNISYRKIIEIINTNATKYSNKYKIPLDMMEFLKIQFFPNN